MKKKSWPEIEDLFRKNSRPLTAFAMQYLGSRQAAEDVVQDTFLYLYENSDRIPAGRNYLYQLVRYRCINSLDYQKVRAKSNSVIQKELSPEPDDPVELIARIELENRFLQALEGVHPKSRKVFEMSRFKGMKNRQIAEKLHLSIRTVETHISLVLKALKDALKDYLPVLITCFCMLGC